MQRRIFIKNTCLTCLGGGLSAALAAGCKGLHYVSATMEGGRLALPKSAFEYLKNKELRYRRWVLVKSPHLDFPIAVFRSPDAQFFASYLQCPHQGCELQPEGNYLQCPCHGAEFDNRGNLQQGPAETNLKTFPVASGEGPNLYILLT